MDIVRSVTENSLRAALPDLKPGLTVRVHQKIKDGNKSRTQIFEGIIISRKHGVGINSTITVRKVSDGIGIERIFPIHLTTIERYEIVKASKVRRAKLYYLRTKSARETKKKMKIVAIKSQTKTTTQTPTEVAPAIEENIAS